MFYQRFMYQLFVVLFRGGLGGILLGEILDWILLDWILLDRILDRVFLIRILSSLIQVAK